MMPSQAPPRRFKQTSKWNFRVGEYADERSYGRPQNAVRRWTIDDFDVVCELGEGCFGLVSLAIDSNRKSPVALKEVTKYDVFDKGSVTSLRGEVEIQTRYVFM